MVSLVGFQLAEELIDSGPEPGVSDPLAEIHGIFRQVRGGTIFGPKDRERTTVALRDLKESGKKGGES